MGEILLSLALIALVLVVYFVYYKEKERLVYVYKNQGRDEYDSRLKQNYRNSYYNDSLANSRSKLNKELSPVSRPKPLHLNEPKPQNSFLSYFLPKKTSEVSYNQTNNYKGNYKVELSTEKKANEGKLFNGNLFNNIGYVSPIRKPQERLWEPNFFENHTKEKQNSINKENLLFKELDNIAILDDFISNNK